MASNPFDPFGSAVPVQAPPQPARSAPPTNVELLTKLRRLDRSGTGIVTKEQAAAGMHILDLGFADEKIEQILIDLEARAGGTIRIEHLAAQLSAELAALSFEAHGESRRAGGNARQMQTGLAIAVFDEAGHATSPDPDRPPSPSYSGSLNSPGAVMGVPDWYGGSVADRDNTPGPPNGGGMFPRSVSADPFQTSSGTDDIFGLSGMFPTQVQDDSVLQQSSQAASGGGIGLIAPPRQKSSGGTPTDHTHSIGWGRQGSGHGGVRKKKRKRRKNRGAGSREATPDYGQTDPDSPGARGESVEPHVDDDDDEDAETPTTATVDDEKEQPTQQRVDALAEMKRGTAMLKYGRRGFPHFRRFQISQDNQRLLWFSKKKTTADTSVLIQDIVDVKEGQQTEVFKQCTQPALERASFSVIYGTTYKTLDVVAKSREEAQMWVKGLRQLAQAARDGMLDSISEIPVMVNFTDITRPRYREQMGGKKKAAGPYNNPELARVIQRNLDQCKQRYQALVQLTNTEQIRNSEEFENVSTLLVEMEERLEDVQLGLTQKSAPLSSLKRDTWVIKVDITVLEEKVKVINRGG